MMLGRLGGPNSKPSAADPPDAGPLGVLIQNLVQLMLMMLGRQGS